MLFITISYAWKKWEQGQVAYLAGHQPSEARSPKECEVLASKIVQHLETFDYNCKNYFLAFLLAEFLNITAISSIFAYYYYLLEVGKSDITTVIMYHFKPKYSSTISPLFEIFPREIACLISGFGPSGATEIIDYKCTVLNVYFIELFHIVCLIVSCIVFTLAIINAIFVIQQFFNFANMAPPQLAHLAKSDKLVFAGLSLRKKLIIFLLSNNIDYQTHNYIMQQISSIKPSTINVSQ